MMERTISIFGNNMLMMDAIALFWLFACIAGYSFYSQQFKIGSQQSIIPVMNSYRLEWMRQMVKRDNRMVDAAILGNLIKSITFFASTSILIVAGLAGALTYRDQAVSIIAMLPFAVPTDAFMWEIKVLTLILIFTHAFFKYTWSLRTHHYTCIMVGAAPMHDQKLDTHEAYAHKIAELSMNAARHFNVGLRSYYYGLAALSWFIHPFLFIATMGWVMWVIYRREFRSNALAVLLGGGIPPVEQPKTRISLRKKSN
jgi:uncharacterized membrane protein